MKVVEHAVLFVLPIFTNLFYVKPKKCKTQFKIVPTPPKRRPESAPALTNSNATPPPALKPRSKSISRIIQTRNTKFLEQPNFCLYHSNILYAIFFVWKNNQNRTTYISPLIRLVVAAGLFIYSHIFLSRQGHYVEILISVC